MEAFQGDTSSRSARTGQSRSRCSCKSRTRPSTTVPKAPRCFALLGEQLISVFVHFLEHSQAHLALMMPPYTALGSPEGAEMNRTESLGTVSICNKASN